MPDTSILASPNEERSPADGEDLIWLLGQPHLSAYLDFVRTNVVGGDLISPRSLADEWRIANDRFYDLETEEAGLADTATTSALDASLAPLAAAVKQDPAFLKSFDTLPVEICMVDLDHLIVSQSSIGGGFATDIASQLGSQPTLTELFNFCLPLDRANAPVKMQKAGRNRYIFTSPSTDFRSHDPIILSPSQINDVVSSGEMSFILGLIVGYGSNFLSVVRSDNRLLLQNGYHRAYALRSLGIKHAPAIVQTVTRRDELKVAANEKVCEDPAFYFLAARPPLLKDFFDPLLAKPLHVKPMQTSVEIEFTIKMSTGSPV
jgi:hypothetical protein